MPEKTVASTTIQSLISSETFLIKLFIRLIQFDLIAALKKCCENVIFLKFFETFKKKVLKIMVIAVVYLFRQGKNVQLVLS